MAANDCFFKGGGSEAFIRITTAGSSVNPNRDNNLEFHDSIGIVSEEAFYNGRPHFVCDVNLWTWKATLPQYGYFAGVQYGDNRDLIWLFQLASVGDRLVRGPSFSSRFHRGRNIELEFGFGPGNSYVCRTKPYGSGPYRWAFNYDPGTQTWSEFDIS